MSRTVLLSTSVLLALLLASAAALVVATTKPAEAAFRGRNGDIAFSRTTSDGSFEVFRMGPTGANVRRLTTTPVTAASPAWSSDGSRIVFDYYTDEFQVTWTAVMDADGSDRIILEYGSNLENLSPAWFPGTNNKVVFGSVRAETGYLGNYEIYSMAFDAAGNVTKLTRLTVEEDLNNQHQDQYPAVSPDGTKVAFGSGRGGGDVEIYVMRTGAPEGPDNPPVQLTDNTVGDYNPNWSPDGKKIVYTGERNGNREVLVMNADGTAKKNLTQNAAGDQEPAFSPDGTKIVFHSNRDGDYEIFQMRTDGSSQTRLTRNSVDDISPDWQPLP